MYRLQDKDIIFDGFFDAALAWKCTIVRPWAQGSIGERDTLGTAQVSLAISAISGERGLDLA